MLRKHFISNTSKLLLQRGASSSFKPKIPKKLLPYENGFLIDTRPRGEREVIDPAWKPKIGSNRPLRIEIIDRKDYDFIGQYLTEHFAQYCNLFECQKMSFEEAAPFFFDLLNSVIDKPLSFAAFEDDKLVGFRLNTYHTAEEFPKMYPRGLYEADPKFIIQKDYGQDITNGPFPSRKLNRSGLFILEMYEQAGKFLPKDAKRIGFVEAAGVHPNYMGSGMAQYFSYKSIDLFKKHQCDYWLSFSAAAAAAGFNLKVGGKELFSFRYEDFKDCGNSVLINMCDDAEDCKLILGKVDETLPIIQEYA